jgi:hypothetical protein
MTLAKPSRLSALSLVAALVCGPCWLAFASTERRYGPTTPSGYYVRVTPSFLTMVHTQRPSFTVRVENAAGQPTDEVLVRFVPSEGMMTTGTSHTRGGTVSGMFTAATGSDSPRTAFVIVAVEDVEVTVFIDIVPAVFGR